MQAIGFHVCFINQNDVVDFLQKPDSSRSLSTDKDNGNESEEEDIIVNAKKHDEELMVCY